MSVLESLAYALLVNNPAWTHRLRIVHVAGTLAAAFALLKVIQAMRIRIKTTDLRGPPSPSFFWGVGQVLKRSPDSGAQLEKWAEEYGGVYGVPSALGGSVIVLCDPKAMAHVFAGDPWTYTMTHFGKVSRELLLGNGILAATGENHRRQRKILTPAFSNTAIRNLTSVFYDLGYKAQGAWDSLIESNGGGSAVIEVTSWMNRISFDTIGIAGFSHDFGTLDGKSTPVKEVIDACDQIRSPASTLNDVIFVLCEIFPSLLRLPSPVSTLFKRLNDTMGEISNEFLEKIKKENEAYVLEDRDEKSILGTLITAENPTRNQLCLTNEDVLTQSKVLLLAGYETISTTLTWALIELAKNPDIQIKLRAELLEFGSDPTHDQFSSDLPYLDAVLHETLRMHPPIPDLARMATVDDLIPLSKPIRTRSGRLVDHISVAKGAHLFISVPCINRSASLWGPDAKVFKPERWMREDGIPMAAREIQGHRHLLTFIDGPRTCIGKGFAIAEFKVILSILVKHFVFEFRDGPMTEIETVIGLLRKPKLAGEKKTVVFLRVRRFE